MPYCEVRIRPEDVRIQALHRYAEDLDVEIQSCLKLLPVAVAEIILPAYLVLLSIGCRPVLFYELVHHFVKRAFYSPQWLIQRSYMAKRQLILLYDLADRTLLQCLLEICNKAVDTLRPGVDPFQLFGCIPDMRHEPRYLFIALANGAGEGDDGCSQSDWVHSVFEQGLYRTSEKTGPTASYDGDGGRQCQPCTIICIVQIITSMGCRPACEDNLEACELNARPHSGGWLYMIL